MKTPQRYNLVPSTTLVPEFTSVKNLEMIRED